jgi:hypothetical protein
MSREQIKLSDAMIEKFLDVLAQTGSAMDAARASHPAKNGINSFRSLRERSPEFAERWQNALGVFASNVFRVALQRATVGWEEGVYQKGKRVYDKGKPATIRRFDSALLQKILAALPKGALEGLDFNAARNVQHSGTITHEHLHRRALEITAEDLSLLTPEQSDQLHGILESLAIVRGERQPAKQLEYTDAEFTEGEPEMEESERIGEQEANG